MITKLIDKYLGEKLISYKKDFYKQLAKTIYIPIVIMFICCMLFDIFNMFSEAAHYRINFVVFIPLIACAIIALCAWFAQAKDSMQIKYIRDNFVRIDMYVSKVDYCSFCCNGGTNDMIKEFIKNYRR